MTRGDEASLASDTPGVPRTPCRQYPGTGAGGTGTAGTAGGGRTGSGSSGTAARPTPPRNCVT